MREAPPPPPMSPPSTPPQGDDEDEVFLEERDEIDELQDKRRMDREMGDVVIKPEPQDDAPLFNPDYDEDEAMDGSREEDKPDMMDESEKPEVRVTYKGFTIFGQTLVVM